MPLSIYESIVAVLIAAMFIGGLSAYFVEVNRTYDLNFTESEFDTFNQINAVINLSEEQGTAISGADIDKEAESVTNFFVGAFNAAKRVLTSPVNMAKVGGALISDSFQVLERLGIPKAFSFGMAAILLVIITFGMLRAVLKVNV